MEDKEERDFLTLTVSLLSIAVSTWDISNTAYMAKTGSQQSKMRYIGSTVCNYSTTSSTEVSCSIPIGENLTSISVYLSNSQKTLLTGRVSSSLRSTNGTHNDPAPDYLIDYAYSSTKTTSAGPGTKVLGWCGF